MMIISFYGHDGHAIIIIIHDHVNDDVHDDDVDYVTMMK